MTEDYILAIEEKLDEVMSEETAPRTVAAIAEELRLEYPTEFKRFTSKTVEKYSLSLCGAHFVHINGLLTILDRWNEEGKVVKTLKNGEILWQKAVKP